MCIKRIEFVDHDQLVTFNDELSQAFALTILCRSYLNYGGKITSFSDNTLVAEVFYLRPEKMVLSGDYESMAPFRRVVEAIGVRSKFVPRALPQDQDGLSIALSGLAQAHSGSDTAMRALLAGAAITDVTEVDAMTAIGFDNALAVYMIQEMSAAKDKLTILETCSLVSTLCDFLRFESLQGLERRTIVWDLAYFARTRELPVVPWLTALIESLIRGTDLQSFLRQFPLASQDDLMAA